MSLKEQYLKEGDEGGEGDGEEEGGGGIEEEEKKEVGEKEEEKGNHMLLRTRAWSQTARVQFLAPPLTTNGTWTS